MTLKSKIQNQYAEKFINTASSTRRIFHIFTDPQLDEKNNFKDIYFSQWGTGILLKKGMKYFLLTSYHVLKDYLNQTPLPNTSPFRTTNLSQGGFSSTLDFLYPKRVWKIGSLIPDHLYYDFNDVALVELFNPLPGQSVDHYIDFEDIDVLELEDYRENILLSDSGFSEYSNPYHYEGNNNEVPFDDSVFSSSTPHKRDLIRGLLKKNEHTFHFEKSNYLNQSTNGMSGGLVIGVDIKGNSKIVGMHVSGSKESNIIHFLPMCKIINAIKRYNYSDCIVIDYCYFERISDPNYKVGSIEKDFFNYSQTLSKGTLRSHKSNDPIAYLDDMADFVVENKETFLVQALDVDEVKKTKNNYLDILTLILKMTTHRNERIAAGRP